MNWIHTCLCFHSFCQTNRTDMEEQEDLLPPPRVLWQATKWIVKCQGVTLHYELVMIQKPAASLTYCCTMFYKCWFVSEVFMYRKIACCIKFIRSKNIKKTSVSLYDFPLAPQRAHFGHLAGQTVYMREAT